MTATTTEQWRVLSGYEGRYRVSDAGRVLARLKTTGGERFLTPRLIRGRLLVNLTGPTGRASVPVARLVLLAFKPRAFAVKYTPTHVNGDATDCRLCNLEWEYRYGVAHGRAKLDEAAVKDIRARFFGGETGIVLAEAYGVTTSTIAFVVNGYTWSHVK